MKKRVHLVVYKPVRKNLWTVYADGVRVGTVQKTRGNRIIAKVPLDLLSFVESWSRDLSE